MKESHKKPFSGIGPGEWFFVYKEVKMKPLAGAGAENERQTDGVML